jgi:hypothetical protein
MSPIIPPSFPPGDIEEGMSLHSIDLVIIGAYLAAVADSMGRQHGDMYLVRVPV